MRKRQGFTLVEMMVVMAIILVIMVILSRAFGDSLAMLRKAKGIGDLNEKLRATASILRRDLLADHFDGKRRCSDFRFITDYASPLLPNPLGGEGNMPSTRRIANTDPLLEGCFLVTTSTAGYEATDPDGMPSRRGGPAELRFTVKLRGNEPKNFFSAKVPFNSPLLKAGTTYVGLPPDARMQDPTQGQNPNPNLPLTYNSQWAEVRYFVLQQPLSQQLSPSVPMYTLYRQQAVCVIDNSVVNSLPVGLANQYNEFNITRTASTLHFNTPRDLAAGPAMDTGLVPQTLLLEDVLAFDVIPWNRDCWNYWGNTAWNSKQPGLQVHKPDPNNPYNQLPSPGPTSLTADWFANDNKAHSGWGISKPGGPMDGLRITIRIWDRKTDQGRQITIYQDL